MAIALNTPIKRIIAFVLCLALFAMVIIPPQPAEAVVGTAALIAGAAVSSEVIGSVIATIILAATGVCFDNGFFGDTDNLSTAAYEVGYELVQDMMLTGGNVAAWIDEAIQAYQLLGGFTAGDDIEVPADVLEYARVWANEYYDFSETVSINESGFVTSSGDVFAFTDYNASSFDDINSFIPTSFNITTSDYSEPSTEDYVSFNIGNAVVQSGYYIKRDSLNYYYVVDYIRTNIWQGLAETATVVSGNGTKSLGKNTIDENVLATYVDNYSKSGIFFSLVDNKLYVSSYSDFTGTLTQNENRWCYISDLGIDVCTSVTSITGTDALDVPQTEDKTLYIPSTVDMGTIGEYTVPAIQTLTSDMVLDGTVTDTETDEPTTPDTNVDTGTDAFTVPDTWSGFDAWLKTQAKTFTDFTTLIQQKVTGIATDVADFGTSIKEWINEKWGTFSDFVLTIPDVIALIFEGILADVMEFFQTPINKIKEQLNNTKNRFLPFIQNGFGLLSIWYYVVAWVGSLGAWLSMMFTVWNGLPYAMVVPVYATAVVVVVIGMWRRFFH